MWIASQDILFNLKRALVISLLWFFMTESQAQTDGNMSMYWAMPTTYNAAMAGRDTAMHVSVIERMQWVHVHGAPQTSFISLDMPFKLMNKRHGVGATVVNDKAGLFSTTVLDLQYAYSMKLWGGQLAAGVNLGMINQSFKGGEIYIPDGDAWEPTDEYLPKGDVSSQALDLGLGVYYERKFTNILAYAGLSMIHLNEPEIDLDEYAYSEMKRTYYFTAGCNIPLRNTLFILQPSVLMKSTLQANQFDMTLRATYSDRFWGGISYRQNDAVILMVGADVQSFRFGYSYDIGTSPLAKVSGGSHEVLLSYLLNMNLDKKKKHPHKSIRIL